jgi:hypothetical protein
MGSVFAISIAALLAVGTGAGLAGVPNLAGPGVEARVAISGVASRDLRS